RWALEVPEPPGTCAALARIGLVRAARVATRGLRARAEAMPALGEAAEAAGSPSMVAAPAVVTVSEVELAVRPDFWMRMEPPSPASVALAAPRWAVPLVAVWARLALPTARRKAAPCFFARRSCAAPALKPQPPGREIRRSAGTRQISERAKAVQVEAIRMSAAASRLPGQPTSQSPRLLRPRLGYRCRFWSRRSTRTTYP